MTWLQGIGLAGGVLALGLLVWGLHCLALWLERRGLLYYRRRPEGGGGRWLVLHEIYEPPTEHILEARRAQRPPDHEGEEVERLLARLVALLMASPLDVLAIRLLLGEVEEKGENPRAFYQQAVARALRERPELADAVPRETEVFLGGEEDPGG